MSIADVLTVIILWLEDENITKITRNYGIHRNTVSKIFLNLQKLVATHHQDKLICLGGQRIIFQIDESLFSHRQKYNVGRVPDIQIWVFGIVYTSFKPVLGYMHIAENGSATTLLSIIDKIWLPGTIYTGMNWQHKEHWQDFRLWTFNSKSFTKFCKSNKWSVYAIWWIILG